MNDEQQTQQADDPSGPGWRDVEVGDSVCEGDMWSNYPPEWHTTESIGQHRRRIEPEQPSDSEPGWRDVTTGSVTQDGDMVRVDGQWCEARPGETVFDGDIVRRRIQQPQPSDSESETMEQLRKRLATLHNLAEMSRRQVADEAQKIEQLREQVTTLTRERDRYRNQLAGAIEHSSAAAAQQQVLEALQTWLRPVLELVAEHPEEASPLAVAVLGYLPGIASRLIEE
jgi:hypothetical protein